MAGSVIGIEIVMGRKFLLSLRAVANQTVYLTVKVSMHLLNFMN